MAPRLQFKGLGSPTLAQVWPAGRAAAMLVARSVWPFSEQFSWSAAKWAGRRAGASAGPHNASCPGAITPRRAEAPLWPDSSHWDGSNLALTLGVERPSEPRLRAALHEAGPSAATGGRGGASRASALASASQPARGHLSAKPKLRAQSWRRRAADGAQSQGSSSNSTWLTGERPAANFQFVQLEAPCY